MRCPTAGERAPDEEPIVSAAINGLGRPARAGAGLCPRRAWVKGRCWVAESVAAMRRECTGPKKTRGSSPIARLM